MLTLMLSLATWDMDMVDMVELVDMVDMVSQPLGMASDIVSTALFPTHIGLHKV